jgi:hypothetical protein
MGRHVGHGRCLACGPSRGDGGRIADLPSGGVRLGGQGPNLPDTHLATGEGSEASDGITRARVVRCLHFEQRHRSLRAVGGPHGQQPAVVLAQRHCAWSSVHTEVPLIGSVVKARARLTNSCSPNPSTFWNQDSKGWGSR